MSSLQNVYCVISINFINLLGFKDNVSRLKSMYYVR